MDDYVEPTMQCKYDWIPVEPVGNAKRLVGRGEDRSKWRHVYRLAADSVPCGRMLTDDDVEPIGSEEG